MKFIRKMKKKKGNTLISKGCFGFCRPESLGIVVGIVFLVLAILFQYFNFTADSNVSVIFP